MSPDTTAVFISAGGLLLSLVGSAFIAGLRWGSVKVRLELLESGFAAMATKDQLAGVKEDVAEIKGMFRMTLRDVGDGRS